MMTKEPRDWATIDSSITIGDKVKKIVEQQQSFNKLDADLLGDRACDADGSTEEGALPVHCSLEIRAHTAPGRFFHRLIED